MRIEPIHPRSCRANRGYFKPEHQEKKIKKQKEKITPAPQIAPKQKYIPETPLKTPGSSFIAIKLMSSSMKSRDRQLSCAPLIQNRLFSMAAPLQRAAKCSVLVVSISCKIQGRTKRCLASQRQQGAQRSRQLHVESSAHPLPSSSQLPRLLHHLLPCSFLQLRGWHPLRWHGFCPCR